MAIQWQDIQFQGNTPSFRPIQQVEMPIQEVPVSTEQNPYFNRGFQQEVAPMSYTSFGQPNAVNPNENQWTNQFVNALRQNAEGSVYSQSNRMGSKSYDCSSLQARTLRQLGINVNPNMTTATMHNDLTKVGFVPMKYDPSNLQVGDILHRKGHTETYIGNGMTVGAFGKKKGVGIGKLTPFDTVYRYQGV